MNEQLQTLIDTLALFPGKENLNMRAILAQSYIQSYGPIPDEYGDQVKKSYWLVRRKMMKYHEKSELDILIDSQSRYVNWLCLAQGRGNGKTSIVNRESNVLLMLKKLRSIKKTMDCLQKGYLNEKEALSKIMDETNSIKWVEK